MKAKLKKTLQGWSPSDEKSIFYHKKFNIGDIYHIDIKHYHDQRIQKMLAKYWVMLQLAVDNSEKYRDKETLHHDIKWALDITIVKQNLITGEMIKQVDSVALDAMDQPTFENYYSDAKNVIAHHVITGTTPDEIESAVMEIFRF